MVVVALLPMVGQVLSHLSSIQGREGEPPTFYGAALALIGPRYFRLLRPHPAADLRGDEKDQPCQPDV